MTTDRTRVDLLKALPLGDRMWVRVGGRSMWPLLLSGDAVLVHRVEVSALSPGDIAVIELRPHVLAAHLVTQVDPLVTESSVGVRDPEAISVIGRVEAFRRLGARIEVDALKSLLTRWPQVPKVARKVPGLRRLVHALRR